MTNEPAASRPPHPTAEVPDRLFSENAAEERWRQRFSATRISLPDTARDAPDRAVYVSNAGGRYELYSWDIEAGRHTVATQRPDGTAHGTLSADGQHLLWFDDTDGDEFGRWRRQSFGGPPGSASPAMPSVEPGYPAGLEVGNDVEVAGFVDDDGTRIHLSVGGGEPAVVYQNGNDASVDGLSRDETVWVLAHSEHDTRRCGQCRCPTGECWRSWTTLPAEDSAPSPSRRFPATSGCWSATNATAVTSC